MQKIVLNKVANYLHKAYPEASIGVGGSVAVGTYRKDSDIDILFLLEGFRKSLLMSFLCKEIKVSIFCFNKETLLQHRQVFLLSFHNMPITFIANAVSLHDNKGLITDFKKNIKDIIERRIVLRYILIDELKTRIKAQLQIEPASCIEMKQRMYAVINMIISIFYLKFHADRIVQKQEGYNPYNTIKEDDYVLYEKLRRCLPYNLKSNSQIKDILENHINMFY